MTIKPNSPLQVGEWRYLPEQDKLVKADEQGDFTITADLDNLCQKVANYFIANAGRLITKDELLLEVWGIRDVSDGRVTRVIRVLRVALGDDTRDPKYIETIPKRGYRFIAPVVELPDEPEIDDDSPDTSATFVSGAIQQRSATRKWLAAIIVIASLISLAFWWLRSADPEADKIATIPIMRYQPITSLDGLEFYHSVSSDEKYIVFSYASPEAENITVLMLQSLQEHKRIQLTDRSYSSFGAAFSPDNSRIAYHRMFPDGRCEIRIIKLNPEPMTGGEDELLSECGFKSFSARITWSPDGKYIVYPSASANKQAVLVLQSLGDGTTEQLTIPPSSSFGDYAARFSRKGDKLAFLRDAAGVAQIWLLDLNNRATKKLTQISGTYPGHLDWNLTDSKVIYPSSSSTISSVDINTGEGATVAYTDINTVEVQVAPSGKIYATIGNFAQVNIQKVANKLFNDVESSEIVFSSNRNEILAEVSPLDGGPVAVVSRRSGLPQIWLFYADGKQKQLSNFTENERIKNLVFSPDGQHLLAQLNNELWSFSLEGSARKIFGGSVNHVSYPSWGRNGKQIYFAESVQGRWRVFTLDMDSKDATPELFSSEKELYIESYFDNSSVWRSSSTKKFYLKTDEMVQELELPIELPDAQMWLKMELRKNGLYYTHLLNEIEYQLKFYSFKAKKIEDPVSSQTLYHSRFSVSPDEKHVYFLNSQRGDFDIASLDVVISEL